MSTTTLDPNFFDMRATTYRLFAKVIAKYELATNANSQYSDDAILVLTDS